MKEEDIQKLIAALKQIAETSDCRWSEQLARKTLDEVGVKWRDVK